MKISTSLQPVIEDTSLVLGLPHVVAVLNCSKNATKKCVIETVGQLWECILFCKLAKLSLRVLNSVLVSPKTQKNNRKKN